MMHILGQEQCLQLPPHSEERQSSSHKPEEGPRPRVPWEGLQVAGIALRGIAVLRGLVE